MSAKLNSNIKSFAWEKHQFMVEADNFLICTVQIKMVSQTLRWIVDEKGKGKSNLQGTSILVNVKVKYNIFDQYNGSCNTLKTSVLSKFFFWIQNLANKNKNVEVDIPYLWFVAYSTFCKTT